MKPTEKSESAALKAAIQLNRRNIRSAVSLILSNEILLEKLKGSWVKTIKSIFKSKPIDPFYKEFRIWVDKTCTDDTSTLNEFTKLIKSLIYQSDIVGDNKYDVNIRFEGNEKEDTKLSSFLITFTLEPELIR